METRRKLGEAKFFLERLHESEDNYDIFSYYLSAFLSAWRSVVDIMLYDVVEHYFGLSRDEKIFRRDFKHLAQILGNKEALQFIYWFNHKIGILQENPLWEKRIQIDHRGYPSIKLFVESPLSTASTRIWYGPFPFLSEIPTEVPIKSTYIADAPEILEMCEKGLAEMKAIVNEAKKRVWNKIMI